MLLVKIFGNISSIVNPFINLILVKYLNMTINEYHFGRKKKKILTFPQAINSNLYEYAFGLKFPKDYSWNFWMERFGPHVFIFEKIFNYEQ